jgi:hypothetical protein
MKTRNSAKGAANHAKRGRCRRSIQRDSQNVSLAHKMERLAEEVTTQFSTVCVKLKELRPRVEQIRSYFRENIRGSVTLSGCRSFREFCEKRLRHSEQAVYRMLSSDTKKSQKKTRVPKVPTAHHKPTFSHKDFERLRSACLAAARFFDAEDSGEKMKAAKAKAAFFAIVRTGTIKPLLFGILAKQDPPPSAADQRSDRPMAGLLAVPHSGEAMPTRV